MKMKFIKGKEEIFMFTNVGKKIQNLAVAVFCILIIAVVVIIGVLFWANSGWQNGVTGVLVFVVAGILVFLAWLSVICLYGYGKMIECSEEQTALLYKLIGSGMNNAENEGSEANICQKCGNKLEPAELFCPNCGTKRGL